MSPLHRRLKSISTRELRNEYARVLREVEAGESYAITSRGRTITQITQMPKRDGPRHTVAFGDVAGTLAYLGPSGADELRRVLDETVDVDVADPFERAATQRLDAVTTVDPDPSTSGHR